MKNAMPGTSRFGVLGALGVGRRRRPGRLILGCDRWPRHRQLTGARAATASPNKSAPLGRRVPGAAFFTGQPSQLGRRREEGRHLATLGDTVGNRISADAVGRRSSFLRGRFPLPFQTPLRPRGKGDAGAPGGCARRPGLKRWRRVVSPINGILVQSLVEICYTTRPEGGNS